MTKNKTHLLFYSLFAILPMVFSCLLVGSFYFSLVLSGAFTLLFSLIWGFSGFYVASSLSVLFLLWEDPLYLVKLESVALLLVFLVSSFITALLEKHWKAHDHQIALLELEKERLFAQLAVLREDLESMEKENLLKELEEDPGQVQLIKLLSKAQKDTQELEEEIALLEEMIAKKTPRGRATKKKVSKEKGQALFSFMDSFK